MIQLTEEQFVLIEQHCRVEAERELAAYLLDRHQVDYPGWQAHHFLAVAETVVAFGYQYGMKTDNQLVRIAGLMLNYGPDFAQNNLEARRLVENPNVDDWIKINKLEKIVDNIVGARNAG